MQRIKIDIIKRIVVSCEICRHDFAREKCIIARRDFDIPGVINRDIPKWCPLPDDNIKNNSLTSRST